MQIIKEMQGLLANEEARIKNEEADINQRLQALNLSKGKLQQQRMELNTVEHALSPSATVGIRTPNIGEMIRDLGERKHF